MARFCLAAIFRNEARYIIEWLAWHRLAGFQSFVIADNGSDDGTLALLEALMDIGQIRVIHQPVLERRSQHVAYRRILSQILGESDHVMFLDADEFLVHDSQILGEECRELERIMSSGDVGAISVNWRCFGSSGQKKEGKEPVVRRFTQYGSDGDGGANSHLKTLVSVPNVKKIFCHSSSVFGSLRYVDAAGETIDDFVGSRDVSGESDPRGGRTARVREGPLRVHHYAIKSMAEYNRKRRRGSATKGAKYDKGRAYFRRFDFSDHTFHFADEKLERLDREISALKQRLKRHPCYGKTLRGVVDKSNAEGVSGWLADREGGSFGMSVNIFVNDVYVGNAKAGFLRPDLKRPGRSRDGRCGFRWYHPKPLSEGDRVEVKVHANASVLAGDVSVVIE